MSTAKGSNVRPDVFLASLWRSSGVLLVTLWRPFGVSWAPLLLHDGRGTMKVAAESDIRPGIPVTSLWRPSGAIWAPLVSRRRWATIFTTKGLDVRLVVSLIFL